MSDYNRVIYTAIFGGKDELIEPKFISDNFDYICFSDQNFESDVWDVRVIEPPVSEDYTRSARKIKILGHNFLPNYKYSIWVDGNLNIVGDLNELVEKYINGSKISTFDHSQTNNDKFNCVYDEADSLIDRFSRGTYKDHPKVIKKQMRKYRKEGYPENNGHSITMLVVRDQQDSVVQETMEDWWSEIKNYSKRDQLSFGYALWKNNLSRCFIPGDSRDNKYVKHTPHKIPPKRDYVSFYSVYLRITRYIKKQFRIFSNE